MHRSLKQAVLVAIAGIALTPSGAGATEVQVVSAGARFLPGNASCPVQYAPLCNVNQPAGAKAARVVMFEGDTLRYTNLDAVIGHDLRSVEVDELGRPLFDTPRLLVTPISAPVTVRAGRGLGDDGLVAGVYPFYCTFHPPRGDGSGMLGVLHVLERKVGP